MRLQEYDMALKSRIWMKGSRKSEVRMACYLRLLCSMDEAFRTEEVTQYEENLRQGTC